jgi:hypothetical protein
LERQGGEFIAYRGAVLPPMCVKCGAPASPPKATRFHWHPPVVYVTILLGLIAYVIVALIVRKRFDLAVPLCDEHLRRRKRLTWTGAALAIAPALAFPLSVSSQNPSTSGLVCFAGFTCFIAGLVMLAIGQRAPLQPKEITEDLARFGGASQAFLSTLD